jgi:hypothetical protein
MGIKREIGSDNHKSVLAVEEFMAYSLAICVV